MLKLAGYSALTATAIYLVLAGSQGPVGLASQAIATRAEAGSYVAPVTEPDPVVVVETTAPTHEGSHADDKDAPIVVQQTAPLSMPGPRLKRSPEYAWKDAQSGMATATPAAAPANAMYVTAPSVNLRGGPSTQNAIVGKVTRGALVSVTAPEENGWVAVLLSDGATRGYLATKFLSPEAP